MSDGHAGEDGPVLRYAPKPLAVVLAWLALLAAVSWAITTSDPGGRVLAVAAVVLLGSLALISTVARPRLAADRDGIQVGRLRGALRWAWRDVHRIEVFRTRRLGRDSSVLELEAVDPDGTERMFVLTRLDLGADPHLVAQALREISAAPGR
ncbi:MAG: PH domain-containing protein [Pseudonocardiaceae bacterium]